MANNVLLWEGKSKRSMERGISDHDILFPLPFSSIFTDLANEKDCIASPICPLTI